MGRGIVISKIGRKTFRKGVKTRVRYPSMMGGYINYTFISKKCAEAHIKKLNKWARSRAKMYKA